MSSEKITLIEGIQILNNNKETAKVLNNFFSTIIKIWKSHNIKSKTWYLLLSVTQLRGLLKIGPTLALLLLRKHVIRVDTCFNFSFVEKEEILKEIKNLKANNATKYWNSN